MSDLSTPPPDPAGPPTDDLYARPVTPLVSATGAPLVADEADAAGQDAAAEPAAAEPAADERYVRAEKTDRRRWIDAGFSLALVGAGAAALAVLTTLRSRPGRWIASPRPRWWRSRR